MSDQTTASDVMEVNRLQRERIAELKEENAGLREALDLMVDTYENGGWPTATIEIAKSALQESSVQETGDE
jgi:hypothetical protein